MTCTCACVTGAGKSTLLDALAMRSCGVKAGRVLMNGNTVCDAVIVAASTYISQVGTCRLQFVRPHMPQPETPALALSRPDSAQRNVCHAGGPLPALYDVLRDANGSGCLESQGIVGFP